MDLIVKTAPPNHVSEEYGPVMCPRIIDQENLWRW